MEDWFILVMIVLAASLLQTSTGYGFSIIGTPILLLLYPAHTAIQINMILSLCLSIVTFTRIGKQTDKPLLFRLMKGSGAGLAAGLLVYLYMDMRWISIFVGGLILLLTVLLIGKVTVRRTNSRDLATGGISGLLTTSIGVPGPPLLLYFSGTGMDKSVLRSTTLVYNLFVYAVSLALQVSFGGTNKEAWLSSLVAFVPLLLGIWLGQLLFKRISQKIFRLITYAILLSTGGYLLISNLAP